MRARHSLLAALLIVSAALAGCPRTMSRTASTPTPTPTLTGTPTPAGWRALPKPVFITPADIACVGDDTCPRDKPRCLTPEQVRATSCAAPSKAECGSGWVPDDCGGCDLACRTIDACPKGMWCDGTKCQSPARCVAAK